MKKGYLLMPLLCFFSGFSLSASSVELEHHAQSSMGSKAVAAELNVLLANQAVLLFQTLNYHWNVVGREFHDYHLLFGKLYDALFKNMDVVAERVRSIQSEALGSMHDMSRVATLKEDTGKTPEPRQMIVNLLDQYELLIAHIHETIEMLETKTKDFGTRKMLEDLIEQYEKTAWMLRSLSEK